MLFDNDRLSPVVDIFLSRKPVGTYVEACRELAWRGHARAHGIDLERPVVSWKLIWHKLIWQIGYAATFKHLRAQRFRHRPPLHFCAIKYAGLGRANEIQLAELSPWQFESPELARSFYFDLFALEKEWGKKIAIRNQNQMDTLLDLGHKLAPYHLPGWNVVELDDVIVVAPK